MEQFDSFGSCIVCGFYKPLNYSRCCKHCLSDIHMGFPQYTKLDAMMRDAAKKGKIREKPAQKSYSFNWITKKYPNITWELLLDKQQEYIAGIIISVMYHCNGKKPCEKCEGSLVQLDSYIIKTIKLNHLQKKVPIFYEE